MPLEDSSLGYTKQGNKLILHPRYLVMYAQ